MWVKHIGMFNNFTTCKTPFFKYTYQLNVTLEMWNLTLRWVCTMQGIIFTSWCIDSNMIVHKSVNTNLIKRGNQYLYQNKHETKDIFIIVFFDSIQKILNLRHFEMHPYGFFYVYTHMCTCVTKWCNQYLFLDKHEKNI